MFKFSANLSFLFNDIASSYLDKYRLASEYGFKYIEAMFPSKDIPLQQLIEAQNKYNLKQILINTEVDDNFGYAAVPGAETSFQISLENTIHYAMELNIKNIHIMSGKMKSEDESSTTDQLLSNPNQVEDKNYITFKNNLIYACKKLKEFNLVALIEPINNYSIPNYYLNNYLIAIKLIKELNFLGIDNIKLQLDIFHLQMIKGNITNTVEDVKAYIGHIQIAQAPYRNEPQVQGEIDYRYVFQLLNDIRYDGFLGLEFKPTNNTKPALDEFLKSFNFKL